MFGILEFNFLSATIKTEIFIENIGDNNVSYNFIHNKESFAFMVDWKKNEINIFESVNSKSIYRVDNFTINFSRQYGKG